MRLLVLVIASIFSIAHAQSDTASPSLHRIKLLSWNIYMLPGFLGLGKIQRSEIIGELIAKCDYDIIVFQEAFHQPSRKRISRHLQPAYPFQEGPANRRFLSFRTNSGLWIFSKHPILNVSAIEFEIRGGIDAMSRKGALLVELNVNGQIIQVIGTHLQNSGDEWIRQGQCVELFHKMLLKHQRLGVPQIICGDFNIDLYSSTEYYLQMLQTLNAKNGRVDSGIYSYDRAFNDLHVEEGNKRELIDFILTRENQSWIECSEIAIKRFRKHWHWRYQDLSDHYSVEASITFKNLNHDSPVSSLKSEMIKVNDK